MSLAFTQEDFLVCLFWEVAGTVYSYVNSHTTLTDTVVFYTMQGTEHQQNQGHYENHNYAKS